MAMRVLLQYLAGEVPEAERADNVAALWAWVDDLAARPEHVLTVAVGEGVRVSADGVGPAAGSVFGVSVVDVADLDAATALVRDWPELAYGGAVDARPELVR
ncbi:YciI family protein [Georgenia sp. TF02-10]|uniref:YciI family protein n=1 Tax=Georgenia sp. TF02-10 TaxID=2917725 RepID=UPI001FA6FAA0|nr:YciI family protein [Georgenia sp. TF02-10]UNX55630.1 YciI family protein [Georgenia sp. TF02-10]